MASYRQGMAGEDWRERDPIARDPLVLNELVDNAIRLGFIRKVYGLLTTQLLVTALIALPFHLYPEVGQFCRDTPALIWVALALTVLIACIISCFPEMGRRVPGNYFLLGSFTIVEAFLVGVITATHSTDAVLMALGITVVVFLGLTLFACHTKADFTGHTVYLLAFFIATMAVALIALFTRSVFLYTVYLWLGVLLFSWYIIYDTQRIVGGKHHEFALSVDDYVFAALSLYLDVINMFLHILSLLDNRGT